LRHNLRPSDFRRRVSGARRAQLDRLMHEEVLTRGILRTKLYGRGALATYSNQPQLIGSRGDKDVERALRGATVSDVSHLNREGGPGPPTNVLEAYMPVRLRRGARPAGVFEVYQDYAPIAAQARRSFVSIAV